MANYTYTNSSLVNYTRISPNRNENRNQPITKITIHHMAGIGSVESFGEIVSKTERQMSANYAIGSDARVGLYCPESDRAWTSNSRENDYAAITIEVSNSAVGDASGWPISDKVMAKLIDLCVDICYRNNIQSLKFTGDKTGTLTYHYMFAATGCPGPYIKNKTQYICDQVNAKLKAKRGEQETKPADKTTTFKTNDLVAIKGDATYYDGKTMPDWVKKDKWYISSIKNDRAVLGKNYSGESNIQSPVNTKYLEHTTAPATPLNNNKTSTTKDGVIENVNYITSLKYTDDIYQNPGGTVKAKVGVNGTFTITKEVYIKGIKYGYLKSGIGWVKINNVTEIKSNTFKAGDKVSVINPIIYGTNNRFSVLVKTYTILSVSGNRAVISADGKNITAAIDTKNIKKI